MTDRTEEKPVSVFLSIISATKNSGATIEQTCLSLAEQSLQDFEHIVIDNCSSDATLAVIKNYSHKYRLRLCSEPDKGIADAVNKGIRMAQGRYILCLHGDDRLADPAALQRAFDLCEEESPQILSFPIFHEEQNGQRLEILRPKSRTWFRLHMPLPHQGCLVRRELFSTFGEFDSSYRIVFDYAWFYKLLSRGVPVRFAPQPLAIMRKGGVSNNPTFFRARIREERRIHLTLTSSWLRQLYRIFWLLYYPYKVWIRRW